MALLNYSGFDEAELSLKDIADMSEEEKKKIIQAGAEVAVEKLKATLTDLGLKRTGQLIAGVKFKFAISSGEPAAKVSSYGKRKNGYTKKRMSGGQSKGSYQGTNEEVLYLLEYGTPRMRPRSPLSKIASSAADPVTDAMDEALGEYLASKGVQ